jgi:phosphoribosylformylglycinamidine synthase I
VTKALARPDETVVELFAAGEGNESGQGNPRATVAVVVFPGSNDDRDAALALELLGAKARLVWHADAHLPPGTAGVVLPGGFSYGDYLRCGAIARFSPIMAAVRTFAADGGPILGICNGFQILCEAGLLPGVLRRNRELEFLCRDVEVVVQGARTPFTAGCEVGQRLVIPVKNGEGNWFADDETVAALEERGQIALRYAADVNGSVARVAGVVNETGSVLGLMPHPEHAVDPLLGSTGGAPILRGLIAAAEARLSHSV